MVGHFKCGETWPWHGWPRQMLKLMSDALMYTEAPVSGALSEVGATPRSRASFGLERPTEPRLMRSEPRLGLKLCKFHCVDSFPMQDIVKLPRSTVHFHPSKAFSPSGSGLRFAFLLVPKHLRLPV